MQETPATPRRRAALVIFLTLFGLTWLTQLNGQVFTNSLVCLGCLLTGICLCLERWRACQQPQEFRFIWGATAVVLVLIGVWVSVQLPRSYRFQHGFNTRTQWTFEAVGKAIGGDPAKETEDP